MTTPHRYFIIHKPANMVSQFVSPHAVGLLGDLNFPFPEGTHAIGRLDSHSEGLLILTTNKRVTKLLFQGKVPHSRRYLVLVKNTVTADTVQQLETGISIKVKGSGYFTTSPCAASVVAHPEQYISNIVPPEKYHKNTWLSLTLTEGKYHQVRKMVAAVGHKCIRLIRISIEDLLLGDLAPGGVKELAEPEFFRLLKIEDWKA